jgi:hypothetical protein
VKVADKVTFCFDLVAVRNLAGSPGPRPASATGGRTVPGCVDNSNAAADTARRPM